MLRTSRYVPLLYLAPLTVLLLVVFGYPLASVIDFSFRRIRVNDGPYIGFANYEQIFKDSVFWESVGHNLVLLFAVPIMCGLALLLALLLYERVRGWQVYRLILFLPYILAVPIIGVVFSNMLTLNGVVNETLRSLGLGVLALDWLGSPDRALLSVMGVIVWREMGFGIVLFLARLMSLNEELEDAAKVDGAVWWQRRLYVTLPQLRAVIEFYVVVSTITMLAWVFTYVYSITRGGPGNATQVLELYMYNFAFRNALPGIASAVAVLLFLTTVVLMIPVYVLRVREQREFELSR